jgi:YD repeat-containing protein
MKKLLILLSLTAFLFACGPDNETPEPDANGTPEMSDQAFSVSEDATIGTVVGSITATDPDGDALTFSAATNDAFAVSSAGEITTLAALDFETTASYTLNVSASDGTNDAVDAIMTINVTDVDESVSVDITQSLEKILLTFEDDFFNWGFFDFDHEYDNDQLTTSYVNFKLFGELGKKYLTYTHTYTNGILTSSEIIAGESWIVGIELYYDYTGDEITKATIDWPNDDPYEVQYTYDSDGVLIESDYIDWNHTAYYTYDDEGRLIKYADDDGDYVDFSYDTNGLLAEVAYSSGGGDTYTYDNQNRVISIASVWYDDEDGTEYNSESLYEYSAEKLTELYYYNGDLEGKSIYGAGFKTLENWSYYYDSDGFSYVRRSVKDDDGFTSHKYYYEGSIDNLTLVGYSVIDSRDSNNKKTQESVYNSSDVKLYYATFDWGSDGDKTTTWFLADGTQISRSDITEEWVTILVR